MFSCFFLDYMATSHGTTLTNNKKNLANLTNIICIIYFLITIIGIYIDYHTGLHHFNTKRDHYTNHHVITSVIKTSAIKSTTKSNNQKQSFMVNIS